MMVDCTVDQARNDNDKESSMSLYDQINVMLNAVDVSRQKSNSKHVDASRLVFDLFSKK